MIAALAQMEGEIFTTYLADELSKHNKEASCLLTNQLNNKKLEYFLRHGEK